MKNTSKANTSLFDLDPSTMICLYRIDLKDKGNYLFHEVSDQIKPLRDDVSDLLTISSTSQVAGCR